MTVHSLRGRTLYVTPIRLGLGLATLLAARFAGSPGTGALLAFACGALGIVFMLYNDPRSRFLPRSGDPLPLPTNARVAPRWRQALGATLPSTVGVTALAVVSLFFQPTLAALLGGVCAGLGVAGALMLLRGGDDLYADPKTHVVYRRTV